MRREIDMIPHQDQVYHSCEVRVDLQGPQLWYSHQETLFYLHISNITCSIDGKPEYMASWYIMCNNVKQTLASSNWKSLPSSDFRVRPQEHQWTGSCIW
jgi:hypothetical protein